MTPDELEILADAVQCAGLCPDPKIQAKVERALGEAWDKVKAADDFGFHAPKVPYFPVGEIWKMDTSHVLQLSAAIVWHRSQGVLKTSIDEKISEAQHALSAIQELADMFMKMYEVAKAALDNATKYTRLLELHCRRAGREGAPESLLYEWAMTIAYWMSVCGISKRACSDILNELEVPNKYGDPFDSVTFRSAFIRFQKKRKLPPPCKILNKSTVA